MNKQSSKSSRSATSASAPAGRASFARLVSHLIPAFGLAMLAGALGGLLLGESASPLLTALLPLKTAHANTIYNTDRLTFSAGDNHACGIRNGALYCWGDNSYGQSGTGGTTTPVPNMTSGVTAVDAGEHHTCAIRNGALLCWGLNSSGQLGDGTTTNRTTPVTVTGMTSGVTAVDAGSYHTCAIRNGALYCWGNNSYGQSGTGGTTTPVPNMTSNVVAVAAEGGHSCAIRNGALLCWGGGGWSGPGGSYGSIPPWGSVPVTVSGMVNGVTNVTAGHWSVCAIRNGGVSCTSSIGNGLGNTISALSTNVTAVASGGWNNAFACAVRNGAVFCWGTNYSSHSAPTAMPAPLNADVLAVSAFRHGGQAIFSP